MQNPCMIMHAGKYDDEHIRDKKLYNPYATFAVDDHRL